MKGALAIVAFAGTGILPALALPEANYRSNAAITPRNNDIRPDSTISSSCCNCGHDGHRGKGSLFKRAMCAMCGINWINVPINRGCPTVTAVPTPTSSATPTATPTAVYNFQGPLNWTFTTQANSPWIETIFSPTDCGNDCTTAGLISVLAGTGQAPYQDAQGRVPVIYEAQLDQYNVSQLQIANFNPNDPHGMKVARLYEFDDGADGWIAFAAPDERAPFGNQTYYEQSYPAADNHASLTLFACGQLAMGNEWEWPVNATLYVARSTLPYELDIGTYLSQNSSLFAINGQAMDFCSAVGAVPAAA